MTPFECQGYWWIPGREDDQCPGTLRCDDAGELRLALLGAIVPPTEPDHNIPLVFGAVVRPGGEDSAVPNGERVTLRDCFETKYSFGSTGKSTQELFAHRAFFGDHLFADGDGAFSLVDVTYSGLDSWAGDLTGLRDEAGRFSVSWERPDPLIGLPFRDGEILIGVSCSTFQGRRVRRLTEAVGMLVRLNTPASEAVLEQDAVYPIQNFLTLATDHPNTLTKLQLGLGEDASRTQWVTVVGPQTFVDDSAASDLLPPQMLFTLSDVRPRLRETLSRWVELSTRFSAALDVYFGLQYRPPEFSDLRFQLAVQVLALYYARLADPPEPVPAPNVTGASAPVLPEPVRALLDSHPLATAERALIALSRRHWDLFGPLVRNLTGEGPERFVTTVIDILRFTFTRQKSAGGVPSGTDFYWRGEQVAFLWKICLLDELGFSTAQQQAVLDRNAKYKHLRDRVRPRLSS